VNLASARISQDLELKKTHFHREVVLYQAKMGVLQVGETLPFEEHSYAHLQGCSFEGFAGLPKEARELAKKQPPDRFSRDPYLQLEKYYRGEGNEVEAKRIHLIGRCELMKHAVKNAVRRHDRNRGPRWPPATLLGDVCLWLLTGYGVRTWRLLLPIFFFLALGTWVFWPTEALQPKASERPVHRTRCRPIRCISSQRKPRGRKARAAKGSTCSTGHRTA